MTPPRTALVVSSAGGASLTVTSCEEAPTANVMLSPVSFSASIEKFCWVKPPKPWALATTV